MNLYWIAFMCALLGPLEEAGFQPVNGYRACVQVYQACPFEDDFDRCLWRNQDHPDVRLVRP